MALRRPGFHYQSTWSALISLILQGTERSLLKFRSYLRRAFLAVRAEKCPLRHKDATLGNIPGKNLEINGDMADRKITVSELKMGLFDGEADIEGTIDLSGKLPNLYATGKVGKIKSDLALKALGSTTKDITGTTFINGNLRSEGTTITDLIGNMGGEVTIYNSDGVIRKWNLLAKIFGALNLYDLLRGKVDFGSKWSWIY